MTLKGLMLFSTKRVTVSHVRVTTIGICVNKKPFELLALLKIP